MLETIDAFTDAGYHVVVAVPEDGPLVAEITARGAEAEVLKFLVLRKRLLSPRGLLRLVGGSVSSVVRGVRLIRRLRPALVVSNTLTIPTWTLAARLSRVASLVHVHEAERGARLTGFLLGAPLLFATAIVVNSQFSLDVLAESFPRLRRRSRVVYNAVPGPTSVQEQHPDRVLRVLYVGRLSHRKGVDLAFEAVAQLLESGVEATLDVVGDIFPGYEGYRDELRLRASRPPLAGSVTFHGFQSDVWPFIAAADVVVVPSRLDEPFGNTAVEAVLSGRPVVASDSSGLREAAGGYRSAQLVTPDDAAAIANALRRISTDPTRFFADAMRDRGVAEERHGPDRYRRDMLESATAAEAHSWRR